MFNDVAGNDAASWAGSTILSQLLITQGVDQLESVPALYLRDFHESLELKKQSLAFSAVCMRSRVPGAGGSSDPHSLCVFLGIGLEPCPIPTSHNAPGLHIKWCGCLTSPVHNRQSLPVILIHSYLTLWA